jgi:heptosyltransferase-2
MKNILVINVNWLGDVVFSAPLFKAIKEQYPQSRVTCLAVPRVKEILECVDGIDEIIVYDEDGKHKSFFGKLSLISQLRQKKFDTALLLHRSLTRAWLVYLAGIPKRIGYDTKGRKSLLTQAIPEPTEHLHRSDYYLGVGEKFGIAIKDRHCGLTVDDKASVRINAVLKEHNLTEHQFVIIHPGGNWALKRWPVQNFNLLIQRLMKDGWKIVITGSLGDQELAQKIVADLPQQPIILTGKLSLKELMAFMQKAKLVISGDSGPIHLAGAVGTPKFGIFGPTRPEITGPRGIKPTFILQKNVGCNQVACYHLDCPSNLCMQAITVEDVLDAVRKV